LHRSFGCHFRIPNGADARLVAAETWVTIGGQAGDSWEAAGRENELLVMTTAPKKLPIPAGPQDLADGPRDQASLWQRLYFALGPIAGCMVLDLADFLTFGPIGLAIGVPVGAAIGWWLGSLYRFQMPGRAALAILSGIYCTIPFTELIPVATIVGAVARFYDPPKAS
jgi:hypothetical protein